MKPFMIRWLCTCFLLIFFFGSTATNGQHAQRSAPDRINRIQGLNFGTFTIIPPGDGSVTVDQDGRRSSSGNIVLLPSPPVSHPAIFEVRLIPGRHVTFTYPEKIVLTGSGGEALVLIPGLTDRGDNPMRSVPGGVAETVFQIRLGGTLFIPANITPGLFSGRFEVSLHQE